MVAPCPPNLSGLPQELINDDPVFVGARLPDKAPINPHTGQLAKVNDPETWGTFRDAWDALEAGRCHAIGRVFTEAAGVTGIDLDHCRNAETGDLDPRARAIVDRLNSYSEVSLSGTGVHILVRARLPRSYVMRGLEVYPKGRHFILTGNHLAGTPETIEPRQGELDALIAEHWPNDGVGASVTTGDAPVIAERARNNSLTVLAGRLRRNGLTEEEMAAALLKVNRARCRPPLPEREVLSIARSVGKYEGGALPVVGADGENGPAVRMVFRTAKELASMTPAHPEWICRYVATGAITELDAKPKAGKTTLIGAAIGGILSGRPFLEHATVYTPVVYLTEERPATFRETLRRNGLLDRDDLSLMSFADVAALDWFDVAELADREMDRRGARLLVVDTLSQFAKLEGDRENNSGDALIALAPLQRIAAKGRAVWLTRHERKGGGEVGESGRGSSGFAGGVDTVMALRRPDGRARATVRVLHALSRFDEVPGELAIEWILSAHLGEGVWTDRYRVLGTGGAVAAHEARAALLADLPESEGEAVTLADFLKSHHGLARSACQRALDALEAEGSRLVRRLGSGKRGDPYRYSRAVILSDQTTHTDGQIETGDLDA